LPAAVQKLPLLLKVEGCWENGLFRSSKAYYLENRSLEQARTVCCRMRSIPRKYQRHLQERHFGQDPSSNSGVVRGVEMRPTAGLQIAMMWQGRALSHALNLKRSMTVGPWLRRPHFIAQPGGRVSKAAPPPLLQDPCHSVSM
jgi:hypothetical protein